MATEYDPAILEKYAHDLDKGARWVAVTYALWGLLLGFISCGVLAAIWAAMSPRRPPSDGVFWVLMRGHLPSASAGLGRMGGAR